MKEEGTGSPLLLLICSQVDVLASAVSRGEADRGLPPHSCKTRRLRFPLGVSVPQTLRCRQRFTVFRAKRCGKGRRTARGWSGRPACRCAPPA